jgi:hypothetical protein
MLTRELLTWRAGAHLLGSSWKCPQLTARQQLQGQTVWYGKAGSMDRPSRTKSHPVGSLSSSLTDRLFWVSPLAFGLTVNGSPINFTVCILTHSGYIPTLIHIFPIVQLPAAGIHTGPFIDKKMVLADVRAPLILGLLTSKRGSWRAPSHSSLSGTRCMINSKTPRRILIRKKSLKCYNFSWFNNAIVSGSVKSKFSYTNPSNPPSPVSPFQISPPPIPPPSHLSPGQFIYYFANQ